MLNQAALRALAEARLEDARILFTNARYDGAAYICGYAIEFALKARICDTLNTAAYPEDLQTFKTHKLETLLRLSGLESHIKQNAIVNWTYVIDSWQPEMRYRAVGISSFDDVRTLIDAATALLPLL